MQNNTLPLSSLYRPAFAGLAAVFIGLGLGRFAYSPLVPAMIKAGWMSGLEASHLIAINLMGYMVGAIFLKRWGKCISATSWTRLALIICVLGLFGRAIDLGNLWFGLWRFLVGFFGATLMIITPSYVITSVSQPDRPKVSSITFTGLGLGILLAGVLVAGLATANVQLTWDIFGIISVAFAALCWSFLPKNNAAIANKSPGESITTLVNRKVKFLIVSYGFCAMGFVPALLFLVSFLVDKLNYDHSQASIIYALLGVGALFGGLFSSFLSKHFGNYRSMLLLLALSIAASIMILSSSIVVISIAATSLGLFFTALVSLKSTRLLELDDPKNHANLWTIMTISFAIGQTLCSYLLIYFIHGLHNFNLCFSFSAVCFAISWLLAYLTKHPIKI